MAAPAAALERIRLGPIHNPVRGVLHGAVAVASLALADHLWARPEPGGTGRAVLLVCALSQFGLYLTSAFYHAIPWGPLAKWRMQRVDHSMIYLGIAGALTPIVWVGLDPGARDAILLAAWGIAAVGTLQKLFLPRIPPKASIPLQLLQASLLLPALGPFAERFPGTPVALLALAAGLYLAGAVCFVSERPRLWPRIFSFHELFHVCTVAATAAFYVLLVGLLGES